VLLSFFNIKASLNRDKNSFQPSAFIAAPEKKDLRNGKGE
jgi:hypothetical protein